MCRADESGDQPGSDATNLHKARQAYIVHDSSSTILVNSFPSRAQMTLLLT
jgi:hypothetical protein